MFLKKKNLISYKVKINVLLHSYYVCFYKVKSFYINKNIFNTFSELFLLNDLTSTKLKLTIYSKFF